MNCNKLWLLCPIMRTHRSTEERITVPLIRVKKSGYNWTNMNIFIEWKKMKPWNSQCVHSKHSKTQECALFIWLHSLYLLFYSATAVYYFYFYTLFWRQEMNYLTEREATSSDPCDNQDKSYSEHAFQSCNVWLNMYTVQSELPQISSSDS